MNTHTNSGKKTTATYLFRSLHVEGIDAGVQIVLLLRGNGQPAWTKSREKSRDMSILDRVKYLSWRRGGVDLTILDVFQATNVVKRHTWNLHHELLHRARGGLFDGFVHVVHGDFQGVVKFFGQIVGFNVNVGFRGFFPNATDRRFRAHDGQIRADIPMCFTSNLLQVHGAGVVLKSKKK